jgi:hypothetical protein
MVKLVLRKRSYAASTKGRIQGLRDDLLKTSARRAKQLLQLKELLHPSSQHNLRF